MATRPDNPIPQERSAPLGEYDAQREKLETIGRLASGVAHDFANLVTLISGYSEMLLTRMDPRDPQRTEIEEIRKAADRGARLTSQLLGFTRHNGVRTQTVDLNHVIYDIERMLHHIIGENVALETDCAPDLGKVAVDPGQIEQVLINLILNARDALPMGGKIVIRTINADLNQDVAEHQGIRPGPCVLLMVADTGHGIGPTMLDHVFEPFFTTKEKGRGTGLGLSIVQNIVRQNGGAVWVSSELGQGATFTVCIPRAEAKPAASTASGVAKSNAGDETILLVEDDTSVRSLLARILRDRGYTVLEACNGKEGTEVFEHCGQRIDLVLTDIMMPVMSGLEFANWLRARSPELRILCMSGYTEDVLVSSGGFTPGMPLLRKPLRPDALLAGVRDALDSRSRPFDPS